MATFRSIVVSSAILVVFAVGAFTAFQVADTGQDGAPDRPVSTTNESVVVEYDSYQYVDSATEDFTTGFNNSSVAVYNSAGAELTRGEDYAWNNSDGTVLFHDTAATTEGNGASISYEYRTNTETVREVSRPLMAIVSAVGWIGIAGASLSIVVLLLAFAGFIVSKIGSSGAPRTNR